MIGGTTRMGLKWYWYAHFVTPLQSLRFYYSVSALLLRLLLDSSTCSTMRPTLMQCYFRWFYESLPRLRGVWSQILSDLIRIASYGACLLEKMFLRDMIIGEIWPNVFFRRPFSTTFNSDWKRFCTRTRRNYTTVGYRLGVCGFWRITTIRV